MPKNISKNVLVFFNSQGERGEGEVTAWTLSAISSHYPTTIESETFSSCTCFSLFVKYNFTIPYHAT